MRNTPRLITLLLVMFTSAQPTPATEPIPEKLVVLTFDDSSKSHFTVARPLLLKHKFKATFFITEGFDFPTNKKDYMTWQEIALLHKDGFEIGNHTVSHMGINDKNLADLPAQLRGINAQCQKFGIPTPVSFAYPGNAITPAALPILKDLGIRFARRGGAPEYPYTDGKGFAFEPGKDHPLLLPTAGDARPHWNLENLKLAVNQARSGKIAILQFHGVPDTAHAWVNTNSNQFEIFLNYLAAEKFTVIAMRDLAKYSNTEIVPKNPTAIIDERINQLKMPAIQR